MDNSKALAFPVKWETSEPDLGLSKRELFAAMAMQGMELKVFSSYEHMLNDWNDGPSPASEMAELVARAAVAYADALIAQLSKAPEGPEAVQP